MRPFIKHFFRIFIITIVSLYACDFIYTIIYKNSNPRNKLQYIIQTKNQFYDIVFLGSSRVANHIDTKLFDSISNKKSLNLGVEGAGLNDNLLQLKLLINQNKISNLYLQIDSNFESTSPSNIAISEAMPYIRNEIIKTHLKTYFKNFEALFYIPFYRYAINDPKIGFRETFFTAINKKPKTDPNIGFTPKNKTNINLKKYFLPNSIQNQNKNLNEIISICDSENINLILFTAPFCEETENLTYIDQLKMKFPSLIDFSKNYNDDLFFNCSHLNIEGAKVFTKDLYTKTQLSLK